MRRALVRSRSLRRGKAPSSIHLQRHRGAPASRHRGDRTMAEKPYRFLFRMPEQLRQRLVASAEEHSRSLNSELLSRLERSLEADAKVAPRVRIAALVARTARPLPGARRVGYALAAG